MQKNIFTNNMVALKQASYLFDGYKMLQKYYYSYHGGLTTAAHVLAEAYMYLFYATIIPVNGVEELTDDFMECATTAFDLGYNNSSIVKENLDILCSWYRYEPNVQLNVEENTVLTLAESFQHDYDFIVQEKGPEKVIHRIATDMGYPDISLYRVKLLLPDAVLNNPDDKYFEKAVRYITTGIQCF